MAVGAVTFYGVVLFVHISAAIVAFGVTFAYPLLFATVANANQRALPAVHHAAELIGSRIIGPAAAVLLLAGIYLVADGPYEIGDPFVGAGIAIIVIIMALGGAFFGRQAAALKEISEQAIEASPPGGHVSLGDEYDRRMRLLTQVGWLNWFLVLLAVFLMVTKPGS